ncbi:type IV toxin-antitoxin system AbiEi family antitoxin domain-containing protein [Sphingobium limneticum]|uniref:type IV toxin-antitoxin system AbiEi family antitoxin domain-containing protein n=1 Tax=Sphingobium limneticum TaxID=1007511 RepID=UPI003CFD23ED
MLQSVAFRLPHAHTLSAVKNRAAGGVVRARALSLVRARNVASTDDFAKVGVSRQSVSRLCKDGLIQRVRHGWYRAAHHAADARLNA